MDQNKSQVMPNQSFDSLTSIQQQVALIKERGLDSYLNKDLALFRGYFQHLKNMLTLPANNENFEEAYENFYRIFDAVPVMYNRLIDMPIFRATRSKINEVFSTQERISYNKLTHHIGPGKFNVWYQSMFYGCLPYKPTDATKYPPPLLVAALECCKDLYNSDTSLLVQDITVGRWKIEESIIAINLCFDHIHLQKNTELQQVNNNFLKHLSTAYSPEASQFIKDLFEFFSSLCRTGSDEQTYYILTALFSAIKKYHAVNNNLNVEALISPSAASEGHGLNIVMEPATVDRCLSLDAVMMERYFLILPEKQSYTCYPCTEVILNTSSAKNFNYNFSKYIPISPDYISRHQFKDYGYQTVG